MHFNKIRTINKVGFLTLLMVVLVAEGYGQDFKLAGIQYNNYLKSEVKDGSENQEIDFQEFGVFVNFPKRLKNNKTVLINGVGYGFVEATMNDFPSLASNPYDKKLQEFYYQLVILHQWNKKWGLMVNLKPTLVSDFEEKLSSGDFVFQGAVIATRTLNDKLNRCWCCQYESFWNS
ncbi:MAG: hypothetical protein GKR88_11035 [Flavobacteriaceae bacterium]|nr:MAG: hypothetical protein GKR88_11035 [Flavobacteriaceae bacterium]